MVGTQPSAYVLRVTSSRRRLPLLILVLCGGLVLTGCASGPPPVATPQPEPAAGEDDPGGPGAYEVVEETDCEDSEFECVTLAVPRDHFAEDAPVWEVTFGIRRADGDEAMGTFVTATGGPGSSGLAVADDYTEAMSEEIRENYDIVFFDQRGIGESQPFRCDDAIEDYFSAGSDFLDPAQRDDFIAEGENFVTECVAESSVPEEEIPYYATAQAAEDLEAFRDYLGVDQLALYGESYGTQYVQTYAAAYPDNVSALIVDGVVDLSDQAIPYYTGVDRAEGDVLERILDACDDESTCRTDAPGDSLEGYDELAEQLTDDDTIRFDYPLADGMTEQRDFDASMLEAAASGYLGFDADRMQIERAVNSGIEGNLVPLARLAYNTFGVDPDSLDADDVPVDESFSDALFFAVECQDYAFFPEEDSTRARLDAWIEAAQAGGSEDERLSGAVYGDLTCLFWPGTPTSDDRPELVQDNDYPVLVMTADTDTPTPTPNALSVFGQVDNASLVLLRGGPHVIYGRGDSCVDDPVTELLVNGEAPDVQVTICEGDVAIPYLPNAPDDAVAYDTAEATVAAVSNMILGNSEYYDWDGSGSLEVGCDFGGSLSYAPGTGSDIAVTFDACEFTDGVPVAGTGALINFTRASFEVTLPFAQLSYSADGAIGGTFRDVPVG